MKLKNYTLLAFLGVLLILLNVIIFFVCNIAGVMFSSMGILANHIFSLIGFSLIALFFYKLYKNQN